MKVLFTLVLSTFVVCTVLAYIEPCSEVTKCSETMKKKCREMSESLTELDGNRKLSLACKNGVCMCNIDFIEQSIAETTSEAEEKENVTELEQLTESTTESNV